jgi:hypothetical protein
LISEDELDRSSDRRDFLENAISNGEQFLSIALRNHEQLGHVANSERVEALRSQIATIARRLKNRVEQLWVQLLALPCESPDKIASHAAGSPPRRYLRCNFGLTVQLPAGYRDSCPERGPWLSVNDPLLAASDTPVSALLADGTTKPTAKSARGVWHGWDPIAGKLEVLDPIACRAVPPAIQPKLLNTLSDATSLRTSRPSSNLA